jgi:glycosyltransferase involved in cell wall biosynthesis
MDFLPTMKLSVIIPAYNEEDRIVNTLKETFAYLEVQAYESEVLIVSDGSHDQTGQVVNRFSPPERVRLRFLEYHPNRGKGYAVRYGMLRGQGQVMMFMDADYSVPMVAVEDGLELLAKGYHIAIASRAVAGANVIRRQSLVRELSATLYTFIQNRYLGLGFPDTQCGFKLFIQSAARDLFPRQKLDSVIFDPEILFLAKRRGYKIAQFPVVWTHDEASRIQYDRLGKSLFVFRELFRIRPLHRREESYLRSKI